MCWSVAQLELRVQPSLLWLTAQGACIAVKVAREHCEACHVTLVLKRVQAGHLLLLTVPDYSLSALRCILSRSPRCEEAASSQAK
ncbi:hypothetical protein E2C01_038437 [Portunus trituberculatus]|uniref:Uncharacterized protein n=1 Tax=Portunus trituberculatus TaxID=210409 RepID=A0A5B7FGT7_PORTR|nr:hypothetical protein [Portunus trituberculatus]